MIKKLLIANRGEIACRIIRTARRMGIQCAAVYSDADRNALHVQMADSAFYLGASPSTASYLNAQKIIAVATDWQADAIHPGYGFLSENSDFVTQVQAAGMRFIGPDSAAIAAMGSKARAKELMAKAGVPLLPGYHGSEQSPDVLYREALKMGFPLLIKAVAGGGGRGLRVVETAENFRAALQSVQRESLAAFADQRVLLEKYLPKARHVEVQVFADQHGNCVHLFERDCSVQRRHQKLIEEAPAPGISAAIRKQMGDTAIKAATEINYCGAGTVEFLYQDEMFYFMEMNTRLQVEHPVTEAITGLDLVEWQIRVAQGETLPLQQQGIKLDGWAIEARINAENPQNDFMPCSGLIQSLHWPQAQDVRVDTGFRSGDRVSVYYDSLLAKVIVWAPTRTQAATKLAAVLAQTRISGIETNHSFLQAVLESSAFLRAEVDTGFLHNHQEILQLKLSLSTLEKQLNAGRLTEQKTADNWGAFSAWRNFGQNPFSREFHVHRLPAPGHDADASAGVSGGAQLALKAPLPGKLIALHIKVGDKVTRGQPLLVMEAMKMEHTVKATADCVIAEIHCAVNEFLQPDQLMVEFTAPVDAAVEA